MSKNEQWLKRWNENQIAFHETSVNQYLQRYLDKFSLKPGASIFLPLCGKSEDIAWLAAQGYQVTGIELSELAIEAFFEEHKMRFQSFQSDRFVLRKAGNISLLQGDFFDLHAEDIGDCDLVFDRAALIAIEEERRADYCKQLMSIIPASCSMLLITLDYLQSQMKGPPYAVSEAEVSEHYAGTFSIDMLERNNVLDERPRWREQGLDALNESVYRLHR